MRQTAWDSPWNILGASFALKGNLQSYKVCSFPSGKKHLNPVTCWLCSLMLTDWLADFKSTLVIKQLRVTNFAAPSIIWYFCFGKSPAWSLTEKCKGRLVVYYPYTTIWLFQNSQWTYNFLCWFYKQIVTILNFSQNLSMCFFIKRVSLLKGDFLN